MNDQFRFLTSDFESAWSAFTTKEGGGRGNYLFASMTMVLLEWCSRVCTNHRALEAPFIEALQRKSARYFLRMPMPVNHRVYARGALLGFPKTSPPPEKAHWLLNVLFALLRDNLLHRFGGDGWPLLDANGNCLDESQCFDVCVSGNDGQALTDMTLESSHLLENSSPPAGMKVGVWFHPGIAFCHFRDAAIRAGLAADGITAAYQQSFAPVSEDAIRSAIG